MARTIERLDTRVRENVVMNEGGRGSSHGQARNEMLMSQGDLADSPGFQGAKGEAGAELILKK